MIQIERNKKKLILTYSSDFQPTSWLDNLLNTKNKFPLVGVFILNSTKLHRKIIEDDFGETQYQFVIGELVNDYYGLDKSVFDINHNIFLHKDIPFSEKHFVATSKISLMREIDAVITEDLYIGGKKESILPFKNFQEIIKSFPTTHEVKLYRKAKVTSVLRNYIESVLDKETDYQKYLNKKSVTLKSKIRKTFKESEIQKYQTLVEKIESMLNNEKKYSEKQWQEEIIQIILLLFPKYIAVFNEVNFIDIYSGKTRRLDYGVIDFMGNLDIVEIKIPFEKSIISDSAYRDNHIPNKELSGTIMQIEKYIFYLNKSGKDVETKLTAKYKSDLPKDLEIKITNPNAIVIMGRDNKMSKEQISDFQIIKRKYKNVIDIFTYDDLVRRLKIIIEQLRKV